MKIDTLVKTAAILLLVVLAMAGCKKQKCDTSPYKPSEIPALVEEGYNTCEAVCKNYAFISCGRETEEHHWYHSGDTIKVCGYLPNNWDGNRNAFTLSDNPNNPEERICKLPCFLSEIGLNMLPEEIDMHKKCFVKGQLVLFPLHTNSGPYPVVPHLNNIQEIHFE